MMDFVNQRIINGKTYTAWRDASDPSKQYIKCEGKTVQTRLKTVWNDNQKVRDLFA